MSTRPPHSPPCSACQALLESRGVNKPHPRLRRFNEAVPDIVVYKCRTCGTLVFHNSKNGRWL